MDNNDDVIAYNPHIDGDDYFAEYNASIKKNFNKDTVKYHALTYSVFTSNDGAEWLRITKAEIQKEFAALSQNNAELVLAYNEGRKSVIYQLELILKAIEMKNQK